MSTDLCGQLYVVWQSFVKDFRSQDNVLVRTCTTYALRFSFNRRLILFDMRLRAIECASAMWKKLLASSLRGEGLADHCLEYWILTLHFAVSQGIIRPCAAHAWGRRATTFFRLFREHKFLPELGTEMRSFVLTATLKCQVLRKLGTEVPTFLLTAELSCQVLRKLGTEVSSFILKAELRC